LIVLEDSTLVLDASSLGDGVEALQAMFAPTASEARRSTTTGAGGRRSARIQVIHTVIR
jgi:hypothetical protein